jgi:hypothetical protein
MSDNLPPGIVDPGLDHAVERWCPDCGEVVVPHGMVCAECTETRRLEAEDDDWPLDEETGFPVSANEWLLRHGHENNGRCPRCWSESAKIATRTCTGAYDSHTDAYYAAMARAEAEYVNAIQEEAGLREAEHDDR